MNLLEVKDLSYFYRDSQNGIKDINLTILPESFNVITGEIGSGKTTLLKTIIGLLPRTSGDIFWNGKLIDDPSSFFVPPISSYTSQVPKLFSESILQNILLGLPYEDERVVQAIRLAVLNEDLTQLEGSMDTIVGPKGIKLSGGQKQRLAASRMFYRNAELLVVDDLSSALDVETEKKLWEQIFEEQIFEKTRTTYLVVSHRKAVLKQADQIILMNGGKIVAKGQLQELLETSPKMRELWQEQETRPTDRMKSELSD